MLRWKRKLGKSQSMTGRYAKKWQKKMNTFIPEKVHAVVTTSVRHMVQATLAGSEYVSKKELDLTTSFEEREEEVQKLFKTYKNTAIAEGIGTGAGGVLLGMADFPLLLSIKMKFLFDTAITYGYDCRDFQERLFLLTIFQLAFSEGDERAKLLERVENWEEYASQLPTDPEDPLAMDWKAFQLSYRDFIDLPKMLQLIPGFGAIVGGAVNNHLLDLLQTTAMNSYRMRMIEH
ncbi:EcsC family protein [Alkalicoccobacillus porphyridii]|uniref:EcsC family protein n=2 Tax=Alkalicoccobacillus porphyridii TaxID=2597270 RepID=A0A553ZWR3_9BACI|nr:EcsC family protein [Alkalicoccobacillus porphyridii]